jgi:RNA 2',3'-cyclic 3'-phosphodiesterase
MRYFIALEIPEDSRKQIETVQQKLKQLLPESRITDNDKLHLTIAFVGEKPDDFRNDLVEAIKNAVYDTPSFTITPAYIDAFPDLQHPHTLWIGVKGDIDKLFIIREKLKDELVRLELEPDDRRYIPHVAIAKTSRQELLPFQKNQLEELMNENFDPIKISCIKLFESIPEEGFHKHNTLAEIPLEKI